MIGLSGFVGWAYVFIPEDAKTKGQLPMSFLHCRLIRLANIFTSPALTMSMMIADRESLENSMHALLPTSPGELKGLEVQDLQGF